MDIVIPLGSGSKWSDNELRYCLRSIDRFGQDISNIYIIGNKPAFLNELPIHIPFNEGKIKEKNIWDKVLKSCNTPEISDSFFFCNDDFFFLKPFSAINYPYYFRPTYRMPNAPYFKILQRSMDLYGAMGLPQKHFDVHRPMIINKPKFINTYQAFEPELSKHKGLIMKSSYCNLNGIEGIPTTDIKLRRRDSLRLNEVLKDVDMFSIYDDVINKNFINYMKIKFPEKSKYEL